MRVVVVPRLVQPHLLLGGTRGPPLVVTSDFGLPGPRSIGWEGGDGGLDAPPPGRDGDGRGLVGVFTSRPLLISLTSSRASRPAAPGQFPTRPAALGWSRVHVPSADLHRFRRMRIAAARLRYALHPCRGWPSPRLLDGDKAAGEGVPPDHESLGLLTHRLAVGLTLGPPLPVAFFARRLELFLDFLPAAFFFLVFFVVTRFFATCSPPTLGR